MIRITLVDSIKTNERSYVNGSRTKWFSGFHLFEKGFSWKLRCN